MQTVAHTDLDVTAWIRRVHSALAPSAVEQSAASWGPVTVRHRTTRPDWFGDFDEAWAQPIPTPRLPQVDVITTSLADLPKTISPPRISSGAIGARGEVTSLVGSSTRMTWNEPGGQITGWDPESGLAVVLRGWSPPWFEHVNPFRWLVHWSVAAAGGALMHAACVGLPDHGRYSGVLLLGEAGYGKSTTALACLTEGWVTCGDDAVPVFCDDEGWHASAVYSALKTRIAGETPGDSEATEAPSPSPAAVTRVVSDDKRVHLLTTTTNRTLVDRIDLVALVLLAPAEASDAPYQRMAASAARTQIAPATALRLPFDKELVLRRIGLLADALPVYRLPRRSSVSQSVADVRTIAEAHLREAEPRSSGGRAQANGPHEPGRRHG